MGRITELINKAITDQNFIFMTQIIDYLITENSENYNRTKKRYDRFIQENINNAVPILGRDDKKVTKINNKIPTDWAGEIITTKIGFFMGKPITFQLNKTFYQTENTKFTEENEEPKFILNEKKYESDSKILTDYFKSSNHFSEDRKIATSTSISGYSGRLLYIENGTGLVKIKTIPPWECIFIFDGSLNEPQYTLRYYRIDNIFFTGSKVKKGYIYKAEWYTEKDITFYERDEKGKWSYDYNQAINENGEIVAIIPNMFPGVSLFPLYNNEQHQSDFKKALDWMDDYDRQSSNLSNELEEFANAILKTYGFNLDKDKVRDMRSSGSIDCGLDGDMKWLEKKLETEALEKHLARAKQNIINTSQHVDFNEEEFGGNIPIIGIHFKLFGLKTKSTDLESYFREMMTVELNLVTDYWKNTSKADIDPLAIDIIMLRDIPFNTKEEAETARIETGILSQETILANMSKVDDIALEIERKRLENESGEITEADLAE
jgi:SPP1 family phage portal protein